MPIQYYHKSTLRSIASVFGELIKVDYMTESTQRGKYARMVIKVNLKKPLVSIFKIDDCIQKVEYEDLPVICYDCRRFGHNTENCLFKNGGNVVQGVQESRSHDTPVRDNAVPTKGQLHGPWMHAQKRGRRNYGKTGFLGKNDEKEINSRFEILADLGEDWKDEANPENHGSNQGIPIILDSQRASMTEKDQLARVVLNKGSRDKGKERVVGIHQSILKEKSKNILINKPISDNSPAHQEEVLSHNGQLKGK